MKVAAIVPSLNPDEKFAKVIDDLIGIGFTSIYVVDDGSDASYRRFFDEAAQKGCVVLRHEVNKGKGRALKTAFACYLDNCNDDYVGVVTLDGDGQHSAEDCLRVAKALEENPEDLILGVRDFSAEQVPTKNALGNKITRGVFRVLCGFTITDTQTGLRGISNNFARHLLTVGGERYEYETNMLLETRSAGVKINEVTISTIYIDDNAASHFRPFHDSLKIYGLILKHSLLKFLISSLSSTALDLLLFALLDWLLAGLPPYARLFIATGGARITSATYNFFVNKILVFNSNEKTSKSLGRYTILCIVQGAASYGGVYLLHTLLNFRSLTAKVIIDSLLFLMSFIVQRRWVFKIDQ